MNALGKAGYYTSLRIKLLLPLVLMLLVGLGGFALQSHTNNRDRQTETLSVQMESLGNFIALASSEAIYGFDVLTLDRYISELNDDPVVHFAAIFSADGHALSTVRPDFISQGQMAEVASGIDPDGSFQVFRFPIVDQGTNLGQLILVADTQALEKQLLADSKRELIIYALMVLAACSALFLFVHQLVIAPVRRLVTGADAVSEGNLDHAVAIQTRDEFHTLAGSFNQMVRKIKSNQSELLRINDDLRVEIDNRIENERRLLLAASVFGHAREGILITDPQGTIIDVNAAFTQITGYEAEEAIGRNPRMLKSGRQSDAFYDHLWQTLRDTGSWSGEVWNQRKDGEVYAELLAISAVKNEDREVLHYVALFSDITAQKRHQEELEYTAHHDALTGLPNRVLLEDRLRHAMAQAQRRGRSVSLLYIDLDGFKEVNDVYGHQTGDKLLKFFSQRMVSTLREGDTVARLGGDEFVALLEDLEGEDDYLAMVKRLLAETAQPFYIDGASHQVTGSIGVTVYPQKAPIEADQLLRQADQAMYGAKQAGRNRYHLYDPEADQHSQNHLYWQQQITDALGSDKFVLHYQPKVDFTSGQVIGLEALIRLYGSEGDLLTPQAFLPWIEEHDLSIDLGEWVIRTALDQMKAWRAEGLDLPVSVNVNNQHLQSQGFADSLIRLLDEHPDMPASRLEIEILESSALVNLPHVAGIIEQLSERGVSFALDDFGTGYSSLTHLKHLPPCSLKIDRSFVADMLADVGDFAIVEGIIGLATAFRSSVIAEGVETEDQARQLAMLGCRKGQGYCFAHPMPAEDIPGWLIGWRPAPQLQGIRPVPSQDRPILYAALEHRAWVSAIGQCVSGKRAAPPPLETTECRFGRWYHSNGRRFEGNPAYQALDELHHQVHDSAKEILALQAQGKNGQARAQQAGLHRLSAEMVEKIYEFLT